MYCRHCGRVSTVPVSAPNALHKVYANLVSAPKELSERLGAHERIERARALTHTATCFVGVLVTIGIVCAVIAFYHFGGAH